MRNKSSYLILCACLGTGLNATLGQMPPAVVGSDYTASVPVFIAPGGLTTIFVQGIGSKISQPLIATTVPLPTKLGGISVSLKQTESPQGPIAVPLLAVFPVNACRSPVFQPCGALTGINLQVPFELVPNPSRPETQPQSYNYAQLVISEDGGAQAIVEAMPLSDRIHILRTGDTLTNPGAANIDRPLSTLDAIVSHADGTLVTLVNPALPGETVVVYAVGLGPVTPSVTSGESTPTPAPVTYVTIAFDFNFHGEVSPHKPTSSDTPVFAGLTPGFVGLYQVNFVIPELPQDLVACNKLGRTNLTVSLGRITSFDGAKICVQVKGQVANSPKSRR